jgi:hypothetical protein
MGIVHETPERPNEFVFYELWKGTRADFDAIQGPKTISEGYMENVKQFFRERRSPQYWPFRGELAVQPSTTRAT